MVFNIEAGLRGDKIEHQTILRIRDQLEVEGRELYASLCWTLGDISITDRAVPKPVYCISEQVGAKKRWFGLREDRIICDLILYIEEFPDHYTLGLNESKLDLDEIALIQAEIAKFSTETNKRRHRLARFKEGRYEGSHSYIYSGVDHVWDGGRIVDDPIRV